jgi:BTB/POZ domain-containing protein KCTD9
MADHEIASLEARLGELKAALAAKAEREAAVMAEAQKRMKSRVKLVVGGVRYETSRATIAEYPESMLESLVSGRHEVATDKDGYIFIDRDGKIFRHVLNAVRVGRLVLPPNFSEFELLAEEMEYYGLPFTVDRAANLASDFTRRELVKLLAPTRNDGMFNLCGARFCGLDVSRLSFFSQGHPLHLERADFSRCLLDGTVFASVGTLVFSNALFVEASGTETLFQNANLNQTRFERCKFSGCEFVSCPLTKAVFRDCDLSGCNFRSANFQEAIIERCNVDGACFAGARFDQVKISETDFGKADVSNATSFPVLSNDGTAAKDS